jgi:hypothetical protein
VTIGGAIDHVRQRMADLDLPFQPECYSVSEAVYYLAGGKAVGLTPMRLKISGEDQCHWFLRGPWKEIIDLTAGQYDKPLDYRQAKGSGFYPNKSALARKLMA